MSDDLGFVDTNIFVYAFDRSDSLKKRQATRLLNHLLEHDQIRLRTQILQELFVTLTRKARQPCPISEALARLDDLAVWEPFVVDYAAIREAVALSQEAQLSFWDALVVVSAVRSGAATLYTEDLNQGQRVCGVTIVNPFL